MRLPVVTSDLEGIPEAFRGYYQRVGLRHYQINYRLSDGERQYLRQYVEGQHRAVMTMAEKLTFIRERGSKEFMQIPY